MHGAGARRETAWMLLLRAASLATTAVASLLMMLFPFLLRHVPGTRLHMALPIIFLGIAGAFVHGIGYQPANAWLRVLFGPVCAWVLMIGGAAILLSR